ncbi:SGNH/GDSL hydrolase family protein [Paenibacillus massiliensis]|uniref:SGNH/GDSL hydrolase family protein n=1 Tax=Paenibacillus massiliensis TaxID=225917 RepID=UPI00040E05CA|nr:SGNH/GDSL hydrolase family protein [Paenibacillus massiliensis]
MKLSSQDRWVFIGDSITDCGRARPIGEGGNGALGNGYVAQIDALLRAVYPDLNIRISNVGTSGNTVRDLKERWSNDVLDLKPDWLAVKIGVNDVWRQFDAAARPEQHVYLDEYKRTLRELLTPVRSSVKGLVMITPYYLEANTEDPMRATMDVYGAAVKEIAEELEAILVDTQAAFDRQWEFIYPAALAWDRVHPDQAGHMIITRAVLEAVGFDWNRA